MKSERIHHQLTGTIRHVKGSSGRTKLINRWKLESIQSDEEHRKWQIHR